jgi:hypothetical protein
MSTNQWVGIGCVAVACVYILWDSYRDWKASQRYINDEVERMLNHCEEPHMPSTLEETT